jgi:hypothetical protein
VAVRSEPPRWRRDCFPEFHSTVDIRHADHAGALRSRLRACIPLRSVWHSPAPVKRCSLSVDPSVRVGSRICAFRQPFPLTNSVFTVTHSRSTGPVPPQPRLSIPVAANSSGSESLLSQPHVPAGRGQRQLVGKFTIATACKSRRPPSPRLEDWPNRSALRMVDNLPWEMHTRKARSPYSASAALWFARCHVISSHCTLFPPPYLPLLWCYRICVACIQGLLTSAVQVGMQLGSRN